MYLAGFRLQCGSAGIEFRGEFSLAELPPLSICVAVHEWFVSSAWRGKARWKDPCSHAMTLSSFRSLLRASLSNRRRRNIISEQAHVDALEPDVFPWSFCRVLESRTSGGQKNTRPTLSIEAGVPFFPYPDH